MVAQSFEMVRSSFGMKGDYFGIEIPCGRLRSRMLPHVAACCRMFVGATG